MEIGSKIKKVRELKNYTQEYMAEMLQISQPTYSRFEKDDSDITISQLKKISKILDIKLEDLIYFNEKQVLHNHSLGQANQAHIINQYMSDNERKLYEDKIRLLEEKVSWLEKR